MTTAASVVEERMRKCVKNVSVSARTRWRRLQNSPNLPLDPPLSPSSPFYPAFGSWGVLEFERREKGGEIRKQFLAQLTE